MSRQFAVVAFLGALSPTQADAAPLALGYSGVFSGFSTSDSVLFSAPTSFTFNSTGDLVNPGNGAGSFASVGTFNISGYGDSTRPPP